MSKELNKEESKLLISKKRKRSITRTKKQKKRNDPKVEAEERTEEIAEEKEQKELIKSEGRQEETSGMIVETNRDVPSSTSNVGRNQRDPGQRTPTDENIVDTAIEKMKIGDENSILTILYELSDRLSIAHESIAENPNISQLVKQLLIIFDKYNSPELSIQALISLNFLIDINPYICHIIVKYDGVKKIVLQTQNVEYIDLAENAIKAIEKISHENYHNLLENEAFSSILMFVDFFDSNIKKYVINSCYNMTRYTKKWEIFQKAILPGLPSLTSMTKLYGNSELDKSILDKAILSFYNILQGIKNYKLYTQDESIWETVIQYGLADNLLEILFTFFKMLNSTGSNSSSSGNNSSVYMDTFKNIIKTFQLLCEQSAKISNMLINMNIMETIYSILKEELEMTTMGSNSLDKGRASSSHHTIFNELFPFLHSFFPQPDSKNTKERVITDNSSRVFILFSEKIIPLLIDNFVNISSSNLSIKVLKLINIYCYYSNNQNLSMYIEPLKLANIMSKMLDSKDSTYIVEVFDLVEIIMSRAPEVFMVELIREGLVDNIKQLIAINEEDLLLPTDRLNSFVNMMIDKYQTIYNEILKEDEEKINALDEKQENINSIDVEMDDGSEDDSESESKENEDEESEQDQDEDGNRDKITNKKDCSPSKNITPTEMSNSNLPPVKKRSTVELLVLIIKKQASSLFQKYFSQSICEKIFTKLKILDTMNDPHTILKNLNSLSEKIKYSSDICEDFDKQKIDHLFQLIFNDHKVTFHEIKKSNIIFNLVTYIDENFQINLKERKNLQNTKYEQDIISKLDIIFHSLNYDLEKVEQFISLLQHCISSMNCFKVCLYEYNYKNAGHLFLSAYKSQIQKYKINLVYVTNEDVLNEYGLDPVYQDLHVYYAVDNSKKIAEVDHAEIFMNLQEAILKKKYKGLPLGRNGNLNIVQASEDSNKFDDLINTLSNRKGSEDFENTERILTQLLERKQSVISNYEEGENTNSNLLPLSLRNNQTSSRRTKYNVNFYAELGDKKFYINKKWNLNDLIKEIKHNFKKQEYSDFFSDMKIKFEITVKDDTLKLGSGRKSSTNLPFQFVVMKMEDSNHDIISQNVNQNFIEEILFNKFYHQKIISNPALYAVNKVSPYIYLISLFELAINQFGSIFKFKEKLAEGSLENIKVSSLLIKQVRDPYTISSNTVPSWCKEYASNFQFISSFNSRYLYFKTCTFDLKRSMTNLYVYIKNFMGETITDDKTLANSRRRKYTIDRENILLSTEKLIKDSGAYSGYLEFEYLNETGSGIGPTQEFYSLFVKEMIVKKQLWYKTTNLSLYPAPHLSKEIGFEENEKMFSLLGFIIARALFDDRLIDIPLSSLFWDVVLERPITYLKIHKIDKDLGKAVSDFLNIINRKKEVLDNQMSIDFEASNQKQSLKKYLNEKLLYNNIKIEDIGLNFVIPGYNHIELVEDGYNLIVDANNLEEYVNLILDSICFEGIKDSVEAFKKGFNIVFPITSLNCFSSEELEDVVCGSSNEVWNYDIIYDSIRTNHGYDKNSMVVKYLIETLVKMDALERKKFLMFVTGSPRLPLGGFKNLTPKLTIVKRSPDKPNESPDKYLPTVMTCQNYLKIPEYSSYEIFRSRLFTAMYEGGNSFDLS